jgi:endonuclease-3
MGPLTSRWPDARSLSGAGRDELESVLRPIGMYRTKARNVIALSAALLRDFGGEVPRTSAELSTLPGVGRKTANVVLGAAWGIAEGIAVDTHVLRVAQRLGWSEHDTAERVERDLMRLLPRDEWVRCSHVLIFHGRRICGARAPACGDCPVTKRCPSAFRAETVGRKWRRPRVSGST